MSRGDHIHGKDLPLIPLMANAKEYVKLLQMQRSIVSNYCKCKRVLCQIIANAKEYCVRLLLIQRSIV